MVKVTFMNAHFLWAMFFIPVMIALHFFLLKYTQRRAVLFANFEALKRVTGSVVMSKNITILFFRIFTIFFLTLSAAGATIWMPGPSSDFDYVIAIDSSSSMLADDFDPNRFEVARETAISFVDSVNAEVKIGIVSFSGVSKVETSLTEDRSRVKDVISNLEISSAGGTDITGAMMTATNILLTDVDKSMSIIILTDGRHTAGSPLEEGINYAVSNQVTVHTIGIATEKGGAFELTNLLSTIDSESLKRIADNTGGRFFLVGDKTEMQAAFAEIVKLSEQNIPYKLMLILLIIGLILLFSEWVLLNTTFKTLP